MYTAPMLTDIYLRLSDEEFGRGESGSITNQRMIIQKYCKDNNITIVREFIDDGYSGANFRRPGFENMIVHLQKGLANMVITKDLSRLGRDMIESSMYAEKIFPEMGIKYIAISDNFDSEETNVLAPFQFAMNDVYIREASKKIKQVLSVKRQNGEYCCCPPFGYMKDPKNKSRLIPNPDTAPTVQYIFQLARDGRSAHNIATVLTQEHYKTPLAYRVETGNFTEKGAIRATDEWVHTTVKRILKNETYLGHTILGKQKKVSLKSDKKVSIPEEDWVVTKNTHQPLVSEEDFELAQMFLSKHTKDNANHPEARKSVFRGLIFCENCGAAMCSGGMIYKGERNKYWQLCCNNFTKYGEKRCKHPARIKYSTILQIVKSELNSLISLSDEQVDSIVNKIINSNDEKNIYNGIEEQKKTMTQRLANIDKIIPKLYADNVSGLIDDEQLKSMVANLTSESKSLKTKLLELDHRDSLTQEKTDSYKKFFDLVKSFNYIDDLTPEILILLIERIEVSEKRLPEGYKRATHDNIPFEQDVTIYYRFIGKIDDNSELRAVI